MRLASLIGPDLKRVLKEDPDAVIELLDELHAEDIADLLSDLEPDEAAAFLQHIPAEEAAIIFERLDEHEQESLVEIMPTQSVVSIASEMAPDDRADLFSNLPEAMGDELLEQLARVDPEAAEDVRAIEKWPETSAGHLMTTDYVSVALTSRIDEAMEAVKSHAMDREGPIYNVYALHEGRLMGVATLRDLILGESREPFRSVMREHVISVPPDLDQEEVARQMAKYDLNVMPVVDQGGVILGVITIDDIIDVLTAEQTEDVQKIGAMEPLDMPYFQTRALTFVKKRGVWLVVLFLGEFFTQTALRHYDAVFEAIKGASYYIPLLISAGGNSGSQSSTLVIRGLAVRELRVGDWWRILGRELVMGLTLGTGLGIIGFARVLMYPEQGVLFATTVSLTLVGIVTCGCTVGAMLPLILKRCGLDPATSSTPFVASLVDVLGIVIFVHVAKLVMVQALAGVVVH